MSNGNAHELPPLAAVFLIEFDNRAGYTIRWQRSKPDVTLDGVVEYKSLPSGLHNIKEDLVYFVHDDYAGLSAYHNEPASQAERNAHMLAVGVLVPLSYGRLGKSWRHAQSLRDLARQLAVDTSQTRPLEDYWEKYRQHDGDESEVTESPFASPSTLKFKDSLIGQTNGAPQRARAMSDATTLSPHTLSPYHPALSLPEFITTFGPLVFPLYRAALLRKRILIVGEAPVQVTCNFVYILSILASVPASLYSILPADLPPLRLRPLFNVGIYDIPFLEKISKFGDYDDNFERSWVACTTDQVLTTKTDLYDILVTLPPPYSKNASSRVYPKISTPQPPPSHKVKAANKPSHSPYAAQYPIKATQRDGRRYMALRRGLHRLPRSDSSSQTLPKRVSPDAKSTSAPPPTNPSIAPTPTGADNDDSDAVSTTSSTTPSILEPLSWPLFAYNSFIWWASAGEARTDLEEESANDTDLLFADIDTLAMAGTDDERPGLAAVKSTSEVDINQAPGRRPRGKSISKIGFSKGEPVREMALVAYFHRLTTAMFSTLSEAISREDEENGNENEDRDIDMDNETEEESVLPREGSPTKLKRLPSRSTDGESEPLITSNQDDSEPEAVVVTAEDVSRMGLDIWSEADRRFIEDIAGLWFGRRTQVTGGQVECCGVRVY